MSNANSTATETTKPLTWGVRIHDGDPSSAGTVWMAKVRLKLRDPSDRKEVRRALEVALDRAMGDVSEADGYAVGDLVTALAYPSDDSAPVITCAQIEARHLGSDEGDALSDAESNA
jgi:hypothetical protein